MSGPGYDDRFLARWLNGELSDEELSNFRKTTEFSDFEKLESALRLFDKAEFNKDEMYTKVRKAYQNSQGNPPTAKSPTKRNKILWYSIAASITLIIGFLSFQELNTSTIKTMTGENFEYKLPDSSLVDIAANSKVQHTRLGWGKKRIVALEGLAFFDVREGSTFTVVTDHGNIEVLGTSFSISTFSDFFEVVCFEGMVKVLMDNTEALHLAPGESVRWEKYKQPVKLKTTQRQPLWRGNELRFIDMPATYVWKIVEDNYGIEIVGKELTKDKRFTGTVPKYNIKNALEILTQSFNLGYLKKGGEVQLILENGPMDH